MSTTDRIREALARRRDRFRYEVLRPQVPLSELYSELAPGIDVELMGADGFRQLWSSHMESTPNALWEVTPPAAPETVARVRRGEFPLFLRTVHVSQETNWHLEPFHCVAWPRTHIDSCPYVVPGADLVVLRDLNRMDFLKEYAAVYRATGDESFSARIAELLDSWARQNPYLVGHNWLSPMESGIRLYEWSIALAGIASAPAPSNECCEHIFRSVYRQSEFLAGHFSNWAIPNNHLAGEAATLATFAAYWPVFKRTRLWMAQADATMVEEVKRQILTDGFQFENSVNYHLVMLDFILLYLHAKVLRGETPPEIVLEKARAMAEGALALVAPSGRMPMIGDDSMPHLMVLGGVMGSPGPVVHRVTFEDFVRLEHARLFSTTAWGRELLGLYLPVRHARRFEDAGIDVARAADHHIVFTHGPQHRRPFSNGHLHADAGSFELELDGVPLIVDSGTYFYGLDARLRRHMRGARAHNTVLVDGVEPMEPAEAFGWKSVAAGEALGFGAVGDVVATGCRRHAPGLSGPGVDHTRALVRVGSTLLIVDTFALREAVASMACTAALYFHTTVAPGVAVAEGNQVRLTDAARFVRVFEVLDEPRAEVDLIDDAHDFASSYSPAYGELITGTTIRVSIPVQETLALVSVLRSPLVSVTRTRSRIGQIGCAISDTHMRRVVSLRLEPFGVFVGGRAIVGGANPGAPATATQSQSLEWLDEIDA